MEMNKRIKRIRWIFITLIISVITIIYLMYKSFEETTNYRISTFIFQLKNVYHMNINSRLFEDYDLFETFTFSFLTILMVIIIITLFIIAYIYIKNLEKSVQNQVKFIIDEIENDEFIPSSLEGDLSILEEKVYQYKKRTNKLLQQLEAERKEMSEYIENIAHQIKTPVTTIRLNEEMSQMIQDLSLLDHNTQEFKRLDQLFDSLVKISRLENDTVHLQLELSDMNNLMKNVEKQVSPLLNNTKLHIDVENVQFYYDELWVSEAIYNIIKNCVEENVSDIYIKTRINNETIKIIIEDNGKGINEEDLPHIFERFYRSKNKKSKGLGIGLALSKQIIEKQHGYMKAYNDDHAVFEICFMKLDIKEKVE